MAFKVTANHWEIIINFMELHPDLARGRVNGPSGKDTFKRLWTELTLQLNAIGVGERPVQKWQKTWTDFKYALKKKASDIKADLNGTGGGPAKGGNLTDLEIRIINLLGKTFYEGLGRAENGCSFMEQLTSQQQATKPQDEEIMLENLYLSDNSPHLLQEPNNIIVETPRKSKGFNGEYRLLENSLQVQGKHSLSVNDTKEASDSLLADHTYVQQPTSQKTRKINPEKEMGILYKETLGELKEINKSLKEIANTGRGIEAAINKIADALVILTANK